MTEEELGAMMLDHERDAQRVCNRRDMINAILITDEMVARQKPAASALVDRSERRLALTPLGAKRMEQWTAEGVPIVAIAERLDGSTATVSAMRNKI